MKIRTNNTLTVAISALLLAGGPLSQLQAADDTYSGQAAPPKFTPSYESYPPPPPGGWDGVIDSIDKQALETRTREQSLSSQSATQSGSVQQPPATQGYSTPGSYQMQQPQTTQGYSVPSYGTTQMQQPQTTPAYRQPAYGTPQSQPTQRTQGYGMPGYGAGQMQQQPQATTQAQQQPRLTTQAQQPGAGAAAPAYGTGQMQPQTMQGYRAPGYGAPRGYYRPPYGSRRGYGGGPSYGSPSFSTGRGSRSSMPWGGSSMPWDDDRGGRSTPWGGGKMPWSSKKGRDGWMDRDSFADAWDDMINAPADMGTMPGGWQAPTISTPNPVDVGDEFGTAAQDMPTQMRNVYDENRRSNTYYDRYDRGYGGYDRGYDTYDHGGY